MLEHIDFLESSASETWRSRRDVSALELTTFGLGGNVDLLLEIGSIPELEMCIRELQVRGIPYRALGAGSNVLFSDAGIHEPVIRLGKSLSGYEIAPKTELAVWARGNSREKHLAADLTTEVIVYSLAATSLMTLSRELSAKGLSGLEFAAGIPASLGGALVMNAGAHGHSLSEVVIEALLMNASGEIFTRSGKELNFSYRHAHIERGEIVLAVSFRLVQGNTAEIKEKRSACLEYRRATQPLSMPSSGSVFKNPSLEEWAKGKMPDEPVLAAGAMLEAVGVKGLRRGSVAYSELHANWLVRHGELGDTADAEALIEEGIRRVKERFGVTLVPEMIVWK